MRNYLVLSLLLVFFSLIISSCGGGDGVSQPSSLSTPVPLDPSQTGYIIIKVKWPQNIITTSEKEEKSIISSWISGTKQVFIEILDKDGNSFAPKLTASITQPEEEAKIELIPSTKVIVRAKAYDITGAPSENSLLSTAEKEVDINVGYNKFDLDMGHYNLTLEPSSQTIAVNEDTYLTAKLEIAYDTPENPNEEQPTPAPVNNKQITFTIEPNSTGMVEFDADGIPSGTSINKTTDPNGICRVKLNGKQEGNVRVIANLEPDDPNNPTCNVKIDGVLSWKDDFESYEVGAWPDKWTRDGSARNPGGDPNTWNLNYITQITSYNENDDEVTTKALQLNGGDFRAKIGAIARRSMELDNVQSSPYYEINFRIRSTYGNTDVDYMYFRSQVATVNPDDPFNLHTLIRFHYSTYNWGDVIASDVNNAEIGPTGNKYAFRQYEWYTIKVRIEADRIRYKFKRDRRGTVSDIYETITSPPSVAEFPSLALNGIAPNVKVWYDDVKVYSRPPSEF